MNDGQPRYASIRDYLGLLRRQRLVIVAVPVVFALAALGISLAQSPSYEAEAEVSFQDVGKDLGLLRITPSVQDPALLAAKEAEAIASPRIARLVQRELDTDLSPQALLGAVTTRVGIITSLVLVQAEWGNPEFAAELANAFAEKGAEVASREQLERLEAVIDEVRRDAGSPDTPTGQLSIDQVLARQRLSDLRAAIALTQPAEITARATPPGAPTSPRPVRNTLLGALVGLSFGLLAAFLRDALDRRIRAATDAHDELEAPVLGRVGTNALGSAGLAGNGHRFLTNADLESFRVLRTNLAFFRQDRPLRCVLVTSGAQGEGKSTVAAALAGAAAAAGQQTLLVDGDLRRPVLADRLGIKASPGLSDYLEGTATPEEILQVVQIQAPSPAAAPADDGGSRARSSQSLVCIASGAPPADPAALLASARFENFVAKVKRAYDLVVIDCSPVLAAVDPLEMVPHVDAVLLCVRLFESTREEVRAVKAALSRLPERPTGIVLTGISPTSRDYAYGYYAADAP